MQNQNPNPNAAGQRIMAILSAPAATFEAIQPTVSGGSDILAAPPGRMQSSSKAAKGRHLKGGRVVYDVDVRVSSEVQPQLEVTPITKYGSDPGLVVGRQIAVNRNYICYGLKQGAIRVLNIETALRSLFKGLNQRVTDMAFFAEDVHLLAGSSVDGRVFVWKITEGPDEEDRPQIMGRIVLAIQVVGESGPVHPRVCWHCHKQEVLVVGIGKRVLKLDSTKVGKGEKYLTGEPLLCPITKLIDGVQLVGEHDGDVTDLSMCQWMTTRLVSASVDGTIKIWEDRKLQPIAVLRPHDGQPVNSATFLTAADRPDHIVLITGGPLNREIKIWSSASEEGWLLSSDAESWKCTQTLELKSSINRAEDAFFNQVLPLSQTGLLLLANAKKNAIYAVHLDYGPYPAATRMDYIAEFTVTMPILSFTGMSKLLPHGEHIVQVYCVQTQAIQQYALDLSQCLPPPLENAMLEKSESSLSREVANSEDPYIVESSQNKPTDISSTSSPKPSAHELFTDGGPSARYGLSSLLNELSTAQEVASPNVGVKPLSFPDVDSADISDATSLALPAVPLSPRLSRKLSGFRSPSNDFESVPSLNNNSAQQNVLGSSVDREPEFVQANLTNVSPLDDDSCEEESKASADDISTINSPIKFKHPTHLVTPSEILRANSSSEVNHTIDHKNEGGVNIVDVVNNADSRNIGSEVKVNGETRFGQNNADSPDTLQSFVSNKRERSFSSQASDTGMEGVRECHDVPPETYAVEGPSQFRATSGGEMLAESSSAQDEVYDLVKDGAGRVSDSAMPISTPTTKGKKQKGKNAQRSGSSSPLHSASNSSDSANEPGKSSNVLSNENTSSQVLAMQATLDQLMAMQKDMQKQLSVAVAMPVTKEGRRLETAIGRSMEKIHKANTDALWARFQEESARQEKLAREQAQQITHLISHFINKDLPAVVEKSMKKELPALGQAVARTIIPIVEKTISTVIAEAFQKGVSEKVVNQLEKSVNLKLEAVVARQIQVQFQTSGKQALQESLKSSLEASVIPAFEMSCKAMFEQVDATFQKGMAGHISATQQNFESSHSSLAITLREAINSASSLTQSLSTDLAESHRKLLADLAVAGTTSNTGHPLFRELSNNGPLTGIHEQIEAPVDPTRELSRMIAERRFEEAFTSALQRSDVHIVSWLCSQVDIEGIVASNPLPLSQGVLLSLLQQLACDIGSDTSRKLSWARDVISAINPTDPMIIAHVRPIFEQVYQILSHHRTLPTATPADISLIRMLMHVVNSMLMSCK